MSGSIDGSSNDYFIVAVILTTVVYMFFPIIKIITNHGKLFERKRAKKIALWNSIVVGAIFCIVTSAFIGPWSAAPAFFYYWINSAILTERSDKTADGSEADKNSTQQPYKCAACGRMGPYDGDCPDCGSGEIVFLAPETVQAKEDDIDTACEQPIKETVICNTPPKGNDNTSNITYTSGSIINPTAPMVYDSNAKERNNHSKPIYCTHCGQLIDPETKRCTGCGKRRFPIKPILIILSAVLLLVGVVGVGYHFALPEIRYRKATSYIEQGDYSKANAVLEEIIDYKNSRELMHKHSYTEIVSQVDRTCDTDGYIIRRCVCGKEEKEVIRAAHLFSEATCTEPEKCSRCGATSGEPLGHSDDAFCSRCGKRLFETQEYSGRGKGYIEGVSLPSGKYNITVTHDGNWNFIVRGLPDFYWGKNQLWVNEIGKVSYVYQEKLNAVRDGVINVKDADGSWTITIEAIK